MLISVTRLHVRSIKHIPRFFLHTFFSIRQIKKQPNLISYSLLKEDFFTYWTLSVWESKEVMLIYRNHGHHLQAMKIAREIADVLEYVNWSSDKIPIWKEAQHRLHKHYNRT